MHGRCHCPCYCCYCCAYYNYCRFHIAIANAVELAAAAAAAAAVGDIDYLDVVHSNDAIDKHLRPMHCSTSTLSSMMTVNGFCAATS